MLLLLLSSRSNTKERKMPDPCLPDDGIFDPLPMKDDCNIYRRTIELVVSKIEIQFYNVPLIYIFIWSEKEKITKILL